MGKIYEALKKTGEEPFHSTRPHQADQFGERNGSDSLNHLDFIRYSIGGGAVDREQPVADVAPMLAKDGRSARHELEPSTVRETTLELSRIDPHLAVINEFAPAASEQYAKLAVSLIMAAEERPVRRVMIASAQHGDGRTTVMLNLAGALARARQRVLVIDTDLARPSVLRLLGLEAKLGLADIIVHNAPAQDTMMRIMPQGFYILPARERVDNAAQMLASTAFRNLLDDIDHNFDFVLLDSGPLLTTVDANALNRVTDTTLLVVRSGKIGSAQMGKAIASLNQEKVFGVVLNRAELHSA